MIKVLLFYMSNLIVKIFFTFLCCYTRSSKYKTKVDISNSQLNEIISGLLQGSIFIPLIFTIYIWLMFYESGDLDIVN